MEPGIGMNLRVSAHSSTGGKDTMEDVISVTFQPTLDGRDFQYSYFAMFDGHGGPEAANYAKEHLLENIVSEKAFWFDDDDSIKQAIKRGFLKTHYAMWQEADEWPKKTTGSPSTSGTTATVVFVKQGKFYVAHVGDSAVALGISDPKSGAWTAKILTGVHKPDNDDEKRRITLSGGKVVSKSGVPRVVWKRPRRVNGSSMNGPVVIDEIPFLAISRSLGDFWSRNPFNGKFIVSPEPDVFVYGTDVQKHTCLVLGTDGLWDVLSPHDVINSVYESEKRNKQKLLSFPWAGRAVEKCSYDNDWISSSKRLVDQALETCQLHGVRADNIFVLAVIIEPPGPRISQN